MKKAFLPALLGLAFTASSFATVLTGPGGSGVTVGSSSLISTLDYSDIFTVGAEGTDRPWNGAPTSAGLVVENSYGNPTRSWPSGGTAYGAAISDIGAYTGYPGGSGAGSATGMTQNGATGQVMMFQYNSLRSDFVIQFDAAQTAGGDRVSFYLSDSTNPYAGNSLGIFFRPTSASVKLGIYNPALGEGNSGFTTGIATSAAWNNYAVHLNGSSATFYVNEVSRGTIDLATFSPGNDYSAYSTSYIGFGVDGTGTVKWADNFQVGAAVPEPATFALVGLGSVLLLFRSYRRKNSNLGA